jgi:hypothetical protein
MNTNKRRNGIVLLLLIFAILSLPPLSGCKSAKLEPGGAYAPVTTNADGTTTATQAPDLALFEVDSAFDLAYTATDAVFNIERSNRQMLWSISPQIKHTLDGIRPQAVDAKKRYALARKAYLANPVPANLDALNTVLATMKNLSSAAAAALPNQTGNTFSSVPTKS